ncbi:hypothetical protein CapIbe_023274 [Capra ibex]
MRTMPSSGCPSLEALGESGGCSHHLCTGTTRETRWSLKQISSRLEVLQCGGADRIFKTDSIDFHLQTEPEWVQENLPFGSLCGEEEDDDLSQLQVSERQASPPAGHLEKSTYYSIVMVLSVVAPNEAPEVDEEQEDSSVYKCALCKQFKGNLNP